MVEQLTLNQLVPGSSPGGATKLVFFPNSFAFALKLLGRCSSTVEHLFCKQAVAGSNPIAGSIPRDAADGFYQRITILLPDGVMVAQATLTRLV